MLNKRLATLPSTLLQRVLHWETSCLCKYGDRPSLKHPGPEHVRNPDFLINTYGTIESLNGKGYRRTATWIFQPCLDMRRQRSQVNMSGRPSVIRAISRGLMVNLSSQSLDEV